MTHMDNYGTKQALKLVDEALQSDSRNENEVAYTKYLESVSAIALTLLTNRNAGPSNSFSLQQRKKLIDTVQQCLDRISCISELLEEQTPVVHNESNKKESPPLPSGQTFPFKSDKLLPSEDCTTLILDMPLSSQPKNDDPKYKSLSVLETIDWISTEDPMDRQTVSKHVSPLEKAKKLNESLMTTYEARMARCTQTSARINIALELHRRIAENLKIAREQERAYLQNMQEKKRQIFQEALKKMTLTGNKTGNDGLKSKTDFYVKILQYGEKKKWVEDYKRRLCDNPKDGELVELVIRATLRDSEHPITNWLKSKTTSLCDRIKTLTDQSPKSPSPDLQTESIAIDDKKSHTNKKNVELSDVASFEDSYANNKSELEIAMKMGESLTSQLKESVKQQKTLAKGSVKFVKRLRNNKEIPDVPQNESEKHDNVNEAGNYIKTCQDELESITYEINNTVNESVELFVLTWDQLNEESNRERCSTTLEKILYPDIWPHLWSLCKTAYRNEINSVARSMDQMSEITPAELDFNLQDCVLASDKEYQKIIQLLTHVMALNVPNEKVQVLVHVVKIICGASQQTKDNRIRNMGADDLIPLLSYICIRSRLANLLCECHLLERLINPRYLMGEEGYCLTSLQTAIKYIQSCERKVEGSLLETTV